MDAELRVGVQRQFRITVTGQRLRDLDRRTPFYQRGDVGRPQGVEVHLPPSGVDHGQEVRPQAVPSLPSIRRLSNSPGPGTSQVGPQH
jgi:hypothetical protein